MWALKQLYPSSVHAGEECGMSWAPAMPIIPYRGGRLDAVHHLWVPPHCARSWLWPCSCRLAWTANKIPNNFISWWRPNPDDTAPGVSVRVHWTSLSTIHEPFSWEGQSACQKQIKKCLMNIKIVAESPLSLLQILVQQNLNLDVNKEETEAPGKAEGAVQDLEWVLGQDVGLQVRRILFFPTMQDTVQVGPTAPVWSPRVGVSLPLGCQVAFGTNRSAAVSLCPITFAVSPEYLGSRTCSQDRTASSQTTKECCDLSRRNLFSETEPLFHPSAQANPSEHRYLLDSPHPQDFIPTECFNNPRCYPYTIPHPSWHWGMLVRTYCHSSHCSWTSPFTAKISHSLLSPKLDC